MKKYAYSVKILYYRSNVHIGHGVWAAGNISSLMRYHFQPDDGGYQCSDEKEPYKCGRFVKKYDAQYDGPYGSDACPYGVCRAYGKCLYGFGEEYHAEYQAYDKTGTP